MSSQVSGVRLAERLEKEIKELVDSGLYISSSEFIREAVREKLQKMNTKIIPDEIAEKEIKWFLKQRKTKGQKIINIIDIWQELGIPFDQIDRVMSRLGAKEA